MQPFGLSDIYYKEPEELKGLAGMASGAGRYLMNNLTGADYQGAGPKEEWQNREHPNFTPSIYQTPQMLDTTFAGARARTAALDMLFKAKDMVGRGISNNIVKKTLDSLKQNTYSDHNL